MTGELLNSFKAADIDIRDPEAVARYMDAHPADIGNVVEKVITSQLVKKAGGIVGRKAAGSQSELLNQAGDTVGAKVFESILGDLPKQRR